MKKILFGLVLCHIFIAGCVKKDTKCSYNDLNTIAPLAEIKSLTDSLDTFNITASQHPSGFFYKISGAGTGAGITNLCSNITVTYKGSFFNGKIFDSTANGTVATFPLGQVIGGWQKGIPLISKGGDITLYIPPALGYGANPRLDSQNNVVIPANSYLIFNIHIVDIQN
ncbi:MAG: FKBP-type peptidyl-prolyl cis-trans isomerase [Ginsengibacter sp.]